MVNANTDSTNTLLNNVGLCMLIHTDYGQKHLNIGDIKFDVTQPFIMEAYTHTVVTTNISILVE